MKLLSTSAAFALALFNSGAFASVLPPSTLTTFGAIQNLTGIIYESSRTVYGQPTYTSSQTGLDIHSSGLTNAIVTSAAAFSSSDDESPASFVGIASSISLSYSYELVGPSYISIPVDVRASLHTLVSDNDQPASAGATLFVETASNPIDTSIESICCTIIASSQNVNKLVTIETNTIYDVVMTVETSVGSE